VATAGVWGCLRAARTGVGQIGENGTSHAFPFQPVASYSGLSGGRRWSAETGDGWTPLGSIAIPIGYCNGRGQGHISLMYTKDNSADRPIAHNRRKVNLIPAFSTAARTGQLFAER